MTLIPQLETDLITAAAALEPTRTRAMPRLAGRRRVVALALAAVLALAGAAAAASLLVHEGPAIAPAPRGDFKHGIEFPAPGTGVIAATAPDPVGGPDWAIRLSRSATGSPCIAEGRVLHGRLGRYDPLTGEFRALPLRGPGSCGVAVGARAIAWFINEASAFRGRPARTIVYGVAGSDVKAIVSLGPRGDRPVPISKKRAFITVYDGAHSSYELPIVAHFNDGTSQTYAGRAAQRGG